MAVSTRSSHHRDDTESSFDNPWPPVLSLTGSAGALLRLPLVRATPLPRGLNVKPVHTVSPNFDLYDTERESLCATWLGHAGFLVQLPQEPSENSRPVRIVFDPIFADRASPSSWFGPRRRLPPPCTVEALPEIDFVVISHNHYDHLDIEAIQGFWKKSSPDRPIHFLVPLGVKETLTSLRIDEKVVHELDWWDSVSFPVPNSATGPNIVFVCTPAQHNSGRGILDQKRSLWASWVLQQIPADRAGPTASIYFAGDTGYQTAHGPCPAFKEIGEKYGPFNLAMIPIWRGASLSFLGKIGLRLADDRPLVTLHASPEDAVSLAADVRARHSLAMHFATFAGSEDEAFEPLVRLAQAHGGNADWQEEGGFGAIDMGETITLRCT